MPRRAVRDQPAGRHLGARADGVQRRPRSRGPRPAAACHRVGRRCGQRGPGERVPVVTASPRSRPVADEMRRAASRAASLKPIARRTPEVFLQLAGQRAHAASPARARARPRSAAVVDLGVDRGRAISDGAAPGRSPPATRRPQHVRRRGVAQPVRATVPSPAALRGAAGDLRDRPAGQRPVRGADPGEHLPAACRAGRPSRR